MKFAFSTLNFPDWDLETIADRAKEMGYDGLELDPSFLGRAEPELSIPIVCIAHPTSMPGGRIGNQQAANDLMGVIDAAQSLGCPMVRIPDVPVPAGQNPSEAANRFAAWLAPLADYAAERKVGLLIDNASGFRRACHLWTLLEAMDHPAVGAAWDVLSAALVGEGPALSVPTLNSRIRYVRVADATFAGAKAQRVKLGEGTVRLQELLNRLMGIGYAGWVSLRCDKGLSGELAEADQGLAEALQKLREWTTPPAAAKPKKPAAAPAATPAGSAK